MLARRCRAANATVSAGWGCVCGGEFLGHAFAYDKAYATYSPSRLFVESVLQHLLAQRHPRLRLHARRGGIQAHLGH